jgi:heat shock protein HslJ
MQRVTAMLAALLVAACSMTGLGPADVERSRWDLVRLYGAPPLALAPITLVFEEGQVLGHAGVNQYFAGFTLKGSSFDVDSIGTTRRSGPPDITAQENAFLKALQSATSLVLDGEELALLGPDGFELARFRPGV